MPAKPAKPKSAAIKVTALSLSLDDIAMLSRFAQHATKRYGRSIGRSAVVRALLGHVAQQPDTWAEEHLLPRLRDDLAVRTWGGQLRHNPVKKRARKKK